MGLISQFNIWDDIGYCTSNFYSRDTVLLKSKFQMFQHHWDLTSGTTFNTSTVVNPDLRSRELLITPDVNFYSDSVTKPPQPTNQGWFSLYQDNILKTDNINFGSSSQFTIIFEIFPLDNNFNMSIYPYEEVSGNSYSDNMK